MCFSHLGVNGVGSLTPQNGARVRSALDGVLCLVDVAYGLLTSRRTSSRDTIDELYI